MAKIQINALLPKSNSKNTTLYLKVSKISISFAHSQSVVFILEDDAQNGPDHEDAHRSPAYVVGPYVKTNFVHHTSYTTSAILRTIELILGLPPMSQYYVQLHPCGVALRLRQII